MVPLPRYTDELKSSPVGENGRCIMTAKKVGTHLLGLCMSVNDNPTHHLGRWGRRVVLLMSKLNRPRQLS